MDVSILADTIAAMLPLTTSSLKPLSGRLSRINTEQIHHHLKNIGEKVNKAKQSDSQGLLLPWLEQVKDVVIELSDLMEDLRYKERINAIYMMYRIKAIFQVKKVEEVLKRLFEEAGNLSFPEAEERKLADYEEIKKTAVEEAAVGRENEKKDIIYHLLNGAVSHPVVAIVGIQGIGKTKLARLISEDETVKTHFGSQIIWIDGNHEDLHKNFDVDSIAKHLNDDGDKGYLLVLDDLRIEIEIGEYLQKLKQKLEEAGRSTAGGAILIATRSNLIANKVACFGGVTKYVLQGLKEQESQLLFKKIFESTTSSSNKDDIGLKMLKQCGGVPMAIIMLATLLNRSSGASSVVEEEFKKMFLKELKFIYYDDVTFQKKLCFAYCSLFPRDYLIDPEKLIQLWMAEGFVSESENLEEIGRAYFDDFVPSVFQQVEEQNENNVEEKRHYYRMNPLMHDLAKDVSGDENIVTADSEGSGVHNGMLRASFDFALDLSYVIPDSMFEKAKKLRTILLLHNTNNPRLPHEVKMTTSTCDRIFSTFKSMRVLDLHDLGIKMLPSSIEEMKYLRYLDLSHNNMEKLPSCITKLIHLQTLKLSQCHVLKELPKDLEYLSCLRHLDIEGCLDLTHMPRGMNNLTCLQTLSLFVANKKHVMGGLRELTDLNKLTGHLEISHLEQVKSSTIPTNEADKNAFVKNKPHLQSLTLRWDHDNDGNDEEEEESEDKNSLDFLEPNQNLRVLFLVGYNGKTFSDWLASLQFLVKFNLNDCPKCKFLPPMDRLPNLKVLQLRRMNSLEFIEKNTTSSSTTTTKTTVFPALKELTISDCPKLKSWWEEKIEIKDRPFFSCISKLNIQFCPELVSMPMYPYLDEELILVASNVRSMEDTMHAKSETLSAFPPLSKLKSVIIERIDESPPEKWLKNFISLKKLHIRDCSQLLSLPQGFKSLSSLESLTIERCPELDLHRDNSEWEGLKNLRSLTLRDIPKLKSLPQGLEYVTSLQDLCLYDCPGLTSLLETIDKLTSLDKLVISECRSLGSLPKEMEKLKYLQTLVITDCPLLLPRCQPDTGDDWPQINHIRNKVVKETSQELSDL